MPGQAAGDGRSSASGTGGADEHVTEPIDLGPIDAGSIGDPSGADPSGGASPRVSAREAKRALRRAEAARRKYERAEVRRFTKHARRRRLAWLIGGGSVVLLAVVVVVAAYSPLMALREIRVEGASRLDANEIRASLEGELGTPLPLVDGGEVHRALSGFSLIERYSTESIPPDTLVVRIVEREPVGVLESNGGFAVVDAAGVVMERAEAMPDGLPRIDAEGGIAGDGFAAATGVIRSLPAEMRSALVSVTATTADDVRFELAGGTEVVWGGVRESGLKAEVLANLMRVAPPETVSRYDVSSPESPVTN